MKEPAQPPQTLDRRLLALAAVLTALASVYLVRLADADLWGHLRYGRLLVETGGVVGGDPFAYTTAGRPWCNHESLSQMILWLAYATAGAPGLVALKCLVGGLAMWFLFASIRAGSHDARVWAPVLMLAGVMLGRWFLFRPQLFTFLFFALFVWVLLRHLLGQVCRLWLLPLLLPLWVHLHGGFLAGLAVLVLALALRAVQSCNREGLRLRPLWHDTRPLVCTLAACAGASLLNPLGWRLWPYLWTELSFAPNRRFIDEWQPTRFSTQPWSALLLVFLLGVLAGVCLLAQLRRTRVGALYPWQWGLSCLPLAIMAFQSVRHIPIFTLWAAPVLALLAQACAESWGERPLWERAWLAVTGLVCLPALLTWTAILAQPQPAITIRGPVLGAKQPYGAVTFLRANGLRGRVYNPLWWGSYLTWELYPDILVSADGRNVTLFSGDEVAANLSFYLEDRPDPETPLRQPADFLLVPTDAPVLPRVRADRRWAVLFEDADAVVLVRADEAHAGLLRRSRAGELQVPAVTPPEWFP